MKLVGDSFSKYKRTNFPKKNKHNRNVNSAQDLTVWPSWITLLPSSWFIVFWVDRSSPTFRFLFFVFFPFRLSSCFQAPPSGTISGVISLNETNLKSVLKITVSFLFYCSSILSVTQIYFLLFQPPCHTHLQQRKNNKTWFQENSNEIKKN